VIHKHIEKLKEIYINCISIGNYPGLGVLDCSDFAQKSKLVGNDLNTSAVDRVFIAANLVAEGASRFDNMGNSLCRFQFWEFLLRLA
jgi:hypothetical protein